MTETLSYIAAPPHLSEAPEKIAYKMTGGFDGSPTIIWCGGLKSDMEGSKAEHLHQWAKEEGLNFIRFDYYGHGESSGRFRDGVISRWGQDVVTVMDELSQGDIILTGSSMGGWSSMLAAKARPGRVKALVLINPAPDFTEKLMWANWSDEVKDAIITDGIYYEPSEYDEPYEYSRELIEDGRDHQLLDSPYQFSGPIRILQGAEDAVVPPVYSRKILDVVSSEDTSYCLVKGGDHSLSRPQDLTRLTETISEICRRISN